MGDDLVNHRELEALLMPLKDGQERSEKKVDTLVDHKDAASSRIANLETRMALIESRKVNWPIIAAIIAALMAWILPHLKWS